ncbi:MAG TPA: hypothetical protein VFS76_12465 [Pyrinomonadaceae bacterium]|nr:hypothetical protein [Pyrinomonadaceae bacterium]
MPSGVLVVSSGVSSINGTNLARKGQPNPLAAATNFIAESGFGPGDFIQVDGSSGSLGNASVFFITSVSAGQMGEVMAAAIEGSTRRSRKTGKQRAAKKPAKKPATKSSRKSTRKSTKKSSRKSAKKR